ncbi:hypothetical protein CF328_g3910 [Tilletia controversa]|nr:hypothetical protein CF328_g3910 [Tilletia controversa]KAE8202543.1 hypothetical protein CF335_g3378 [Tilletia laevis]
MLTEESVVHQQRSLRLSLPIALLSPLPQQALERGLSSNIHPIRIAQHHRLIPYLLSTATGSADGILDFGPHHEHSAPPAALQRCFGSLHQR